MDSVVTRAKRRMSTDTDVIHRVQSVFDRHWNTPLLVEAETERTWTYGEVIRTAVHVDSWLTSNGFAEGDSVTFAPTNGPLPLAVYLGTFLSGRAVHVIDPFRGKQDIDEMMAATSADRILTDAPSLANRFKSIRLPGLDPAPVSKGCTLEALSSASPTDPFLTTFTSGTTGKPKGVVHSFENLVRASIRFGDRFGFGPDDTFYHTLPMGYMAGILNALILPMMHGSTVAIGPRMDVSSAPTFFDLAAESGANLFWFTPTMLKMLSKICSGPYEGAEAPIGCVATEPLPPDLQDEFESAFGVLLYETYGLSETLFITTEFPGGEVVGNSVGPPLEHVDLEVESDGEISVDTPWMFLEYLNREGTPVKKGRFPTGDVGHLYGDSLVITGRKNNLIVRNGVNLSPQRIAHVIEESVEASEAVVIGRPAEDVGEVVVAFVVPAGDVFDAKRVQQRIIQKLGSDHRVDQFVERASLPRTFDGELDRSALETSISEG